MEKLSATYTQDSDQVEIYVYRKDVEKPKKQKIRSAKVEAEVYIDYLDDGEIEIVGVEILFNKH